MADILIPNMELPKICAECRFAIDAYGSLTDCRCAVLGCGIYKFMARGTKLERHESCPLVELPDIHGRLIDADFIVSCLAEIKDTYPRTYEIIKGILDRTPTILEATE